MYKNYISIIFLFFVFNGFGQQNEIDSLRQALKIKQHDTIRVNQFNKLAFLYQYSKPDSTLMLSQEAIRIAKKNGYASGVARGLNVSGAAFTVLGNYPKALELFLSSLKKYENIKDLEGIANVTNNIAIVYGYTGKYRESLDYYFKTLEYDKKTGNKIGTGYTLSNIAATYIDKEKIDSAHSYAMDAYDIAVREKNNEMIKTFSTILGEIYDKLNQPGMAMEYYRIAFGEGKYNLSTSESALGMAQIFKDKNLKDSTLYYAKYAYNTVKRIGSKEGLLQASSFLVEYYKENNNIDSAFAYQNISLAAKDSLYSQEKRNKIQALALEETARQLAIKTALIEVAQKKKTNMQYLGITAAIVGFILIFLLLSRSIMIGEKWLSFLGIFILLLVFEFINLYLAPKISAATDNSPIWTLLIMVVVAALLVPLHHKIEKYVTKKMVKKNKQIKLAAARRTIERLEMEE